MATVGIISNPASGKDIRRLVAHGSVFDNNKKGFYLTSEEKICQAVKELQTA